MSRSTPRVMAVWFVLSLALAACESIAAPGQAPVGPAEEQRAELPARDAANRSSAGLEAERVQIHWVIGLGTGTSGQAQEVEKAFVQAYDASQNRIELLLEVGPGGGIQGGVPPTVARSDCTGWPCSPGRWGQRVA
jgi:hypothetical protein